MKTLRLVVLLVLAALPVGARAGVAAVRASGAPVRAARTPNPPARSVLPFIEDDYAHALEVARAKHIPIFIEAWAPW